VQGLVNFAFLLKCFFKLFLSKRRHNVLNASQPYLALHLERNRSINASQQKFKRCDLDIKQVEAKHRNDVVHEPIVEHKNVLVCFLASHIIVTVEINPQRLLEQWDYYLINVKRQWKLRLNVDELHKDFFVLDVEHHVPKFQADRVKQRRFDVV